MRPQTRGDCRHGERPCPWAGCRHHLAHGFLPVLDAAHSASRARVRRAYDRLEERALRIIERGEESCSLDVADRGEHTLAEVNALIECDSRQGVGHIEERALDTLRRRLEVLL